jgi:hypothetical protein
VRRVPAVTLALVIALALALAACGDVRSGTRLTIETGIHQPGTCPGTASMTISIRREGDAALFLDATSSMPASIVWPIGFAAWHIEDGTILYAPDGATVVHDGGTVTIGGAAGGPGEPFRVCSVGARTYS